MILAFVVEKAQDQDTVEEAEKELKSRPSIKDKRILRLNGFCISKSWRVTQFGKHSVI